MTDMMESVRDSDGAITNIIKNLKKMQGHLGGSVG